MDTRFPSVVLTPAESAAKDKVVTAMTRYFGDKTGWVSHSLEVTQYAERILALEPDADRLVVVLSAILHDIGVVEAERKHNSAAGPLQEAEGPPVAREILREAGVADAVIEEVCSIIGSHHSPGEIDTPNFRALWDADCIVNYRDKVAKVDVDAARKVIQKVFMSKGGKEIAEDVYVRARTQ